MNEPMISGTAENKANRANVVKNWNLGPVKASPDPKANAPYWAMMGKVWGVSTAEARCQLCANCEYFDNTPEMQSAMLAIKQDEFDVDGGGRGYCVKFDFACHNLRVCQAWERKDFVDPEA